MIKFYTPVVVGLICRKRKVLLGLRPKKNLKKDSPNIMGNYWEFPGGKINWGEAPKNALRRELKEELSITAEVESLKIAHNYAYSSTHAVLLLFYKVTSWEGEIKNLYHSELKWVESSQLKDYRLLPANESILPQLLAILSEPS